VVAEGNAAWPTLQERLSRTSDIHAEIHSLEKSEIGAINYGLERIRLARRGLELDNDNDPLKLAQLEEERAGLQA